MSPRTNKPSKGKTFMKVAGGAAIIAGLYGGSGAVSQMNHPVTRENYAAVRAQAQIDSQSRTVTAEQNLSRATEKYNKSSRELAEDLQLWQQKGSPTLERLDQNIDPKERRVIADFLADIEILKSENAADQSAKERAENMCEALRQDDRAAQWEEILARHTRELNAIADKKCDKAQDIQARIDEAKEQIAKYKAAAAAYRSNTPDQIADAEGNIGFAAEMPETDAQRQKKREFLRSSFQSLSTFVRDNAPSMGGVLQ